MYNAGLVYFFGNLIHLDTWSIQEGNACLNTLLCDHLNNGSILITSLCRVLWSRVYAQARKEHETLTWNKPAKTSLADSHWDQSPVMQSILWATKRASSLNRQDKGLDKGGIISILQLASCCHHLWEKKIRSTSLPYQHFIFSKMVATAVRS